MTSAQRRITGGLNGLLALGGQSIEVHGWGSPGFVRKRSTGTAGPVDPVCRIEKEPGARRHSRRGMRRLRRGEGGPRWRSEEGRIVAPG